MSIGNGKHSRIVVKSSVAILAAAAKAIDAGDASVKIGACTSRIRFPGICVMGADALIMDGTRVLIQQLNFTVFKPAFMNDMLADFVGVSRIANNSQTTLSPATCYVEKAARAVYSLALLLYSAATHRSRGASD